MHDEMDIKLDKKTDVQDHEYKWKLYYDFWIIKLTCLSEIIYNMSVPVWQSGLLFIVFLNNILRPPSSIIGISYDNTCNKLVRQQRYLCS